MNKGYFFQTTAAITTAVRFFCTQRDDVKRYGLPYKGSKNTMTFPKRTMIQHLSGCKYYSASMFAVP